MRNGGQTAVADVEMLGHAVRAAAGCAVLDERDRLVGQGAGQQVAVFELEQLACGCGLRTDEPVCVDQKHRGSGCRRLPGERLESIGVNQCKKIIVGVPALRIISVSFLLAGFCIIAGSVFQAIGNPVYSLIVSVCRQMVVLLPVAWLLSRTGRLELVWWSFPIAEVMSFTLSTIFLRRTVKSANEVMNSSAD